MSYMYCMRCPELLLHVVVMWFGSAWVRFVQSAEFAAEVESVHSQTVATSKLDSLAAEKERLGTGCTQGES